MSDRRPEAPRNVSEKTSRTGISGVPEKHPAGPSFSDSAPRSGQHGETPGSTAKRAHSGQLVQGERTMMGDGQFRNSDQGPEARNPEGSAGMGADTYAEDTGRPIED